MKLPNLGSELERTLITQCRQLNLPTPELEHIFAPPRKWRFDLCWPDLKIAVEVEGGQWLEGGGGHQRGKGFERDAIKYNEAALDGWMVLRATTDMVIDGRGVRFVERAMEARGV